jgi:4-hydroxybenzoate polyprenyltransferase
LRPHQWSKNLLIFAPVVAAHQVLQLGWQALASFFAFSFVASAFYLLNDLHDIEFDRCHSDKRLRPLAAGTLQPTPALVLSTLLLLLAAVIARQLPVKYALILLCYGVVTLAYSAKIKKMVVLDLVTLAFLYCLRVFAGGAGCDVTVSSWLFSFIFFLALSLAHLKRYLELDERVRKGLSPAARPVYAAEDAPFLAQIGLASGLISVLVSALYVTSTLTSPIYKIPKLLFLMCILLFYWVERIWLFASRAKISGDPVAFIVRDPISYAVVTLCLLIMWVAAR